jgi:hypothetical protein
MLTLALFASLFFAPATGEASSGSDASGLGVAEESRDAVSDSSHVEPGKLRAYLTRARAPSPRFLDHGVLQLGTAGGLPHLYRIELGLGLFDHLSGGVSLHWLPGQAHPQVLPHGAVAVLRRSAFEFGASYRQVLHAPQEASELGFVPRTHYLTMTAVFSQGPIAAGVDAGVVHFKDEPVDPSLPDGEFRRRTLPGGGVFARVGTRRWGVSVAGQMPVWTIELMLDLRFGLFEMRERGGWTPKPR